ncbi:MAG: YciE/YciF ferroxidase family protein [Chloroflexota bacterium]
MPLQNPRDLFVYELSSAHSMEQSLLKQLPQMEQACQNPQVKQLISNHITDTQRQSSRVEECFRMMGVQPMNVTCHAIDCMQQDFQSFMQQSPSQENIDMFCLGATAKTEHYEIATYTGLVEKARLMGETQVVSVLEDNLHEEQRTAQAVEQLGRQIGSQVIQRMRP